MEDRELLEMAAKAAVVGPIRGFDYGFGTRTMAVLVDVGCKKPYRWNPLTDDGDALRLAVKLRISIMLAETTTDKPECGIFDGCDWVYLKADGGGDAEAATRRAIVRAAAEIGKQMP